MSCLLRIQIDNAMQDILVRDRFSKAMLEDDNTDYDKRDAYDHETLLMRRDCIKALRWLENCKGC